MLHTEPFVTTWFQWIFTVRSLQKINLSSGGGELLSWFALNIASLELRAADWILEHNFCEMFLLMMQIVPHFKMHSYPEEKELGGGRGLGQMWVSMHVQNSSKMRARVRPVFYTWNFKCLCKLLSAFGMEEDKKMKHILFLLIGCFLCSFCSNFVWQLPSLLPILWIRTW